jgi:inhibitor of KinA sporulation pathway (predicted exonuclease)
MKKDDIGLQTAYQMYGYEASGPQKHDALEDAMMTSKVYQGFTQYLKGNRKLSFQSKI